MAKDHSQMEDSNTSGNPSIHEVSDPGRRTLLQGAGWAAFAALLQPLTACVSLPPGASRGIGFQAIPAGIGDTLVVPPGYVAQVIAPWGEPIGVPGRMPAFRFDASNSAEEQALQMGMLTPETIIDIRGPIRWGKFRIKDYHNYGAKLSVFDVITKSSNIGAARIAQMIGAEEQKRFLASLGFLAPIPIEMPEASGGRPLVPSKWTELSTMTISYGHGLSATPLHLAVGYAAIANGGYKVTPTLVPNPTVEKGERVISETVSKQAVDMLRSVVTDGTASFGEVAGYAVAGKTGTADKPNPQGAYHEEKVISTFASIFPANDPKYVLVVSLDEPEDRTGSEPRRTAGWTAVPVAAEIIGRIAPLLGMRPLIEKPTRADITLTSTN